MDRISLKQVVPHVFAQESNLKSEVWGKDIDFCKGKTYLVEAASGTGKSTLCSYITGYRHDYNGAILFDTKDIAQLTHADWVQMRQRHISHLYQELRLFPELTAFENIEIKNRLTHHLTNNRIDEMFNLLGISQKRDTPIAQMSFGQQQRVAMIRALAQPFDFILVDEPVSHLDEHNSSIMATLLLEEAREQEAGIIATSIGKHMDLPYDEIIKL